VADRTFTQPPTDWTPVVLRDAGGESSISSVIVETTFEQLGVDDVGLSTTPQPDTEIVAGPASPTSATSADFTFAANQPGTTFTCSLDGRGLAACPAPTLSPVAIGAHTLTASAVDRWGLVDPTPATHSWTVDPAAPLQPSSAAPDPDHDGIPTPADNCPDVANPGQADADHDSVGDACELLPSGDLPPVAGRRVKLSLVSGEVFVRLPAGAALRQRGPARFGFASLAASGSAPPSGFVPLKGVASVPMGSTIDTRKGTLSVQSAATSAPPGARNRRLQAAIFSAGIFRIRQARKARSRASRSKTIPTDALLSSAPGAQNVCAGSARARPLTGVVRTLQISAKGVFRAIGGASVATGRNAIWNTTDRCDGTLTQVGRGRVTVARRSRSTRAAVVTGGRAYLVRARLFAIKKGRPR
jgi:hypothetical protein